MKKIILILVVASISLVACGGFDSAARTTLYTTKKTLDVSSEAFLTAVDKLAGAGLLSDEMIQKLPAVADSFNVAYKMWAAATDAYLAGKEQETRDKIACLVVALEDILLAAKDAGLGFGTDKLAAVVQLGRELLADYVGVCHG